MNDFDKSLETGQKGITAYAKAETDYMTMRQTADRQHLMCNPII